MEIDMSSFDRNESYRSCFRSKGRNVSEKIVRATIPILPTVKRCVLFVNFF
jgi:hypothetical protein